MLTALNVHFLLPLIGKDLSRCARFKSSESIKISECFLLILKRKSKNRNSLKP